MDRADYERVLGVALRLAATDDTDGLLGEIIDAMRDVLRAERASVFTWERGVDGEAGAFVAARAHGLGRSFRVSGERGVIAEAARSGRVVNVPDVSREPSFNAAVDEATGFRTRCLLAAPMLDVGGELVGVVQALNKAEGGVFTAADQTVAAHLAAQAGVALRRAALMAAARRREVLEAEVSAARAMQVAAMPSAMPGVDGWRVEAAWRPAAGSGGAAGDAYDAVALRGADGGERLVAMLADASGHGVGPAVSVSRTQAMFRMAVRSGAGVEAIAAALGERLREDLPTGHFVTAWFCDVAGGGHAARWVSAGQSPVAVFDAKGCVVDASVATEPPLGLGGSWAVREAEVGVGGGVVVASDGVYEGAGGLSVGAVSEAAASGGAGAVIGLRGGAGADDRTVLVLRRVSGPA